MQSNLSLCHVQDLKPNQLILLELPQIETTAFIRITSCNFDFEEYDYGNLYEKKKYGITKKLRKYYTKRHFLFSRFSQGIKIDQESWYSAIAEPISLHIKERLLSSHIKLDSVFQPFCGVGGVALHLIPIANVEYIVNDIDIQKIQMFQHNLKIYEVPEQKLEVLCNDFLKIQPFATDLIILCPPWGGLELDQYSYKDLDLIMKPKLSDILKHALKFSKNMLLQLPKNTNVANLLKVIRQCDISTVIQIQIIKVNSLSSQLIIYLGQEKLTRINKGVLYQKIYKTLNINQDKDKKLEVRTLLKQSETKIFDKIYEKIQNQQNT